jgi:DNA polymerase-3 subunit epsilon
VNWPWTRWLERRRHAGGEYGALFAPYRGDEWIALDLETTGLDPSRDEILSLAAVPGQGTRLKLRDRLDLVVRSDSPRITEAIRHHRLRPDDVAEGVPLDKAVEQLLALIGNRPLVGYCIGFDIAMLDRALRPRLGFGLPNRGIDVQREYAAWQRKINPDGAPDLRFEAMAAVLDVPSPARHSALGDAVSAGLMHIRLRRR